MKKVHFIGIDLAWSPRNLTGVSILSYTPPTQTVTCQGLFLLQDLDDMVGAIMQIVKHDSAIIAIDAPLTVPNQTGRRDAEKRLHSAYYKTHAVAHPANRERLGLWNNGIPRGEELVRLFEQYGFTEDPHLPDRTHPQYIIEAFPHPAQVELFGLEKVLPYKLKKGRTYEQRIGTFREYQRQMKKLPIKNIQNIVDFDVATLRGSSLKAYEDTLDALFCSYIAYYVWKHPNKRRLFGTKEEGHIIVPTKNRQNN